MTWQLVYYYRLKQQVYVSKLKQAQVPIPESTESNSGFGSFAKLHSMSGLLLSVDIEMNVSVLQESLMLTITVTLDQ